MNNPCKTIAACCGDSYDNFSVLHTLLQQPCQCEALVRRHLARSCLAERYVLLEKNVSHTADNGGHLNAGSDVPQRRRKKRTPSGYYGVSQVAEISDSPLSSVYAAIHAGRLKAASWRGLLIVSAKDAEEYAALKPLPAAGIPETEEAGHE